MKKPQLLALALPLMAAAPLDRPITLTVPSDSTLSLSAPSPSKSVPNFAPAPLPNRELAPTTDRASTEPTLGPTLFTSRTQFRGDGFSPGSTAQGDQEHRAKPAAGFSLHMPMTSQEAPWQFGVRGPRSRSTKGWIMRLQNSRQRRQAVAQAKAIDATAIAVTTGLGLLGLLAGLAALFH